MEDHHLDQLMHFTIRLHDSYIRNNFNLDARSRILTRDLSVKMSFYDYITYIRRPTYKRAVYLCVLRGLA